MSAFTERKREITKLLKSIERYPSTNTFKHEMMTYAYVIVCGGIEFMIETILQEWLNTLFPAALPRGYPCRKV
jgi:hypothetical protein